MIEVVTGVGVRPGRIMFKASQPSTVSDYHSQKQISTEILTRRFYKLNESNLTADGHR